MIVTEEGARLGKVRQYLEQELTIKTLNPSIHADFSILTCGFGTGFTQERFHEIDLTGILPYLYDIISPVIALGLNRILYMRLPLDRPQRAFQEAGLKQGLRTE